MFQLEDFPLGSHFYWIRELKNISTWVYTKISVDDHDPEGNLIQHFINKKGNTILIQWEKQHYLNCLNTKSFFIPESLFFQIKQEKTREPMTSKHKLEELLLSGNSILDEIVRQTNFSFHEIEKFLKNRHNIFEIEDYPEGSNLHIFKRTGDFSFIHNNSLILKHLPHNSFKVELSSGEESVFTLTHTSKKYSPYIITPEYIYQYYNKRKNFTLTPIQQVKLNVFFTYNLSWQKILNIWQPGLV